MYAWHDSNWTNASAADHLAVACAVDPGVLGDFLRGYDWRLHPGPVLGRLMARRDIDLATAVTVFFNAGPSAMNHRPRRDPGAAEGGAEWVLDLICLRLNSGLYAHDPAAPWTGARRLRQWITAQDTDRAHGQGGRWVLDERIVAPLMQDFTPE